MTPDQLAAMRERHTRDHTCVGVWPDPDTIYIKDCDAGLLLTEVMALRGVLAQVTEALEPQALSCRVEVSEHAPPVCLYHYSEWLGEECYWAQQARAALDAAKAVMGGEK